MPAIIVSKTDLAGLNIKKQLTENFSFKETGKEFDANPVLSNGKLELFTINGAQIFADSVNRIETDLFIFASRHKSASEKPTLTAHPIGNFSGAEMGGKDSTLIPTSALALKYFLLALQARKESKSLSYEVSLECTHHGPFLTRPAVFVELGSSEAQWKDETAAESVAETISSFSPAKNDSKICIGFGGGHYCPSFTQIELRSGFAFSHIMPKYAFPSLGREIIRQMVSSTKEKVSFAVLDWKGLGKEKQKLASLLEGEGLEIIRSKDIEK